MRLTRYTDYALRALLFLGARPERLGSIAEIAAAHGISQNHLMKVVHALGRSSFVRTVRGRKGGILLGMAPGAIRIGDVVRLTEPDLALVDCTTCRIAPACGLPRLIGFAAQAFLDVLDGYSLQDALDASAGFERLLWTDPTERAAGGRWGISAMERASAGARIPGCIRAN